MSDWKDEQHWESDWWGDCNVTFWEETKQLEYAAKMGIEALVILGKYPYYDFKVKSIIDVGGGPISMLLKAKEKGDYTVVDPCDYPDWCMARYKESGVTYIKEMGEKLPLDKKYDLALCYNVLQHVENPELIIQNMRKVAKEIRICDWVNTPAMPGHPHTLREEKLNEWLHGEGKVEQINKNGCHGQLYFGIFPTGL